MTLVDQIQAARSQFRARARDYRSTALSAARGTVLGAADRVVAAKQPIRTLAVAGQRLSNLSNRYFEQFFGQQAHTLEGVIEAGAERLKRAAKSDSLRSLVAQQRDLGSASRKRLGQDVKATWQIAAETGTGLRDLAVETYAELVHGVKARATPAARTARKPAATRARKAATVRARKARKSR